MEKEDAKNVAVLHTNINVYGFGSSIGPNDKNVFGGEKQPNCKINIDLCSHNEAWNSYSLYLRNRLVTQDDRRIHPYVICLDVSGSMDRNRRLERAIHSAQTVVTTLKPSSFLGIAKFNHEATVVHDIIQIKGAMERKSILTSLPSTADGSTSIGGGLRLSMNMLQAMPNNTKFCSTIVLISDGEQNAGETPKDVLPDLQNACIAVNSIALGKDASNDLEELSSSTDGIVSYASEDGSSQDIVNTVRALSYMFDTDIVKPLRLKSAQVTLTGGKEDIDFDVDDTIGKNTEFNVIGYDLNNVDVTLLSPDGKEQFSSSSPEYHYDNFTQKGFRIPYAEAGQWTLSVIKTSKTRRSIRSTYVATAEGTSYELDGKRAIRLNAIVSDRVLEYPKPVTVTAELKIEEFPIIGAEVYASIAAPNKPVIRLSLYDDGIFPDELANDGLYTNDVVKLPQQGRYSVSVTALSNNTAMLVPKAINYFLRDVVDCSQISCTKLSKFQRETDVGSIKVRSDARRDEIPPHRVSDLRATIVNADERIVSLEWTSPSNEFFAIQVKGYEIKALINGTNFDNGLKLDESNIVKGSLNAVNSKPKLEKISIQMPKHAWNYVVENSRPKYFPELKFALKSIGGNDEISEVSNIAAAVIEKEAVTVEEEAVTVEESTVAVEEEALLMTINEVEVQHLSTTKKVCKPVFWNHPIVGRIKVNFC